MLVTDKQRYLKSRHNLSDYLPIPSEIDWVIQDGEVYPSDITLTARKNHLIFTESGEQFSLDFLMPLINRLEQYP